MVQSVFVEGPRRDVGFGAARRQGIAGVFLTVDSVRFGFREVDARNNFCALPPPLALANYVATPPAAAAWEAREHRAWDQNSEALFDTGGLLGLRILAPELDRLDPSIPLVVKGM